MKKIIHIVLMIATMAIAVEVSFGQGCTTKQTVGKSCQITVATGGLVSTSPTGPQITWQNAGNNQRTYTINWTTNGRYNINVKWEPDQPGSLYMTTDVYYAVSTPTITGDSFVCANKTYTDFTATTANDNNVHDFDWSITPTNAYLSKTESGTPDSKYVRVYWNTSYTGDVTIKATAWGYGDDFKEKTFAVYRKAMETFTAHLAPAVLCEGQSEHISIIASHAATYQWFQDDNNTSFSDVSSPLVNPPLGVTYMVTVTPASGIECLTNPGPLPPIRTTHQNFQVIEKLNAVSITNDMTFKCNGGAPLTMTFSSDGLSDSHTWSVNSNNSSSPGTFSGDVLNWNANYTGTATITLTAHGCNGTRTDTHVISVVPTPPHKSLTALADPICQSTETTLSLTSTGRPTVPETYVLTKVIFPGPNETLNNYTPQTATGWSVGVGTYYVTTTAPNCPTDVTDRYVIDPIVHNAQFASSKGELIISPAWNAHLNVCSSDTPFFTVTEATDISWYVYNKACDLTNINVLPPDKRWDYCHTRMTSFDGMTEFSIWAGIEPKITIKGKENVCNEAFEQEIRFNTWPTSSFKGITPEISARQQGPGTTAFEMEVGGIIDDKEWTIDPPEAGTMSANGEVTWNPNFHSFLTSDYVPVTINARTKDCGGWHEHPMDIAVWPILDSKENRIRTFVPQIEMQSTTTVVQQMEDPLKVQLSAAYFDGLGRNVQNVQYFASPTKDLVDLKRYDEFGREPLKNLPYSGTHTLNYRNGAVTEQPAFYTTPPATIPSDNSPFAKTIFEPSPIDRVVEQGAPGAAFQPGTNHTIKKQYLLNGTRDVIRLNYDPGTKKITLGAGDAAYYDANSLTCVKTIDEDQNDYMEYTDKEGKLVCKKVKAPGGTYACTYYVYDGNGSLVTVVSPEGSEKINQVINQN